MKSTLALGPAPKAPVFVTPTITAGTGAMGVWIGWHVASAIGAVLGGLGFAVVGYLGAKQLGL